ncbi:hypothetical protein D3C71_216470 [compost metagenome]
MRPVKRPLYDIEFPASLRAAVIPFLAELVEEVKRERAADPDLRSRPHEYVLWAEPLLARLAAVEGDFSPLDEMDMETLRKDVLLALMSRQTNQIHCMIETQFDKDDLLALIDELRETNRLAQRLDKAVNYDLFDEAFKGDRPEAADTAASLAG